jgi:hypothetical protein
MECVSIKSNQLEMLVVSETKEYEAIHSISGYFVE